MKGRDLEEMQDPRNWEFDAERPERPRKARAVVSIAFSREDFEEMTEYARKAGVTLSELIRGAALDRIRRVAPLRVSFSSAGGATAYLGRVPSSTRASAGEQMPTPGSQPALLP